MSEAPALEEATAIVFDLSTEELSVLLTMLDVPEIPGYSAEPLDERIEAAVRNGLVAHGVIVPDGEGGWIISELVAAAITAGARAPRIVTVRRDVETQSAEDWLFVLPGVVVQYSRPMDSVHRFQAIFEPEGLTEVLVNLFQLSEPQAVAPAGLTLPINLFDVRQLARQGRTDEAEDAAAHYDLPDDLRAALLTPSQYAALSSTSVQHGSQVNVDGGLAVTAAYPGQYWVLIPDGNMVHAERTDSTGVVTRIAQIMQP
jgi:hypothetical protein